MILFKPREGKRLSQKIILLKDRLKWYDQIAVNKLYRCGIYICTTVKLKMTYFITVFHSIGIKNFNEKRSMNLKFFDGKHSQLIINIHSSAVIPIAVCSHFVLFVMLILANRL